MGERFVRSHQMIPSTDRNNGGVIHNNPDTSPVRFNRLRKIAVTVPAVRFQGSHHASVDIRPTSLPSGHLGGRIEAVRVVPLAREPIQEVFRTSVRGGRVGGGGTSKEALQRAKRKERQEKSKLLKASK